MTAVSPRLRVSAQRGRCGQWDVTGVRTLRRAWEAEGAAPAALPGAAVVKVARGHRSDGLGTEPGGNHCLPARAL